MALDALDHKKRQHLQAVVPTLLGMLSIRNAGACVYAGYDFGGALHNGQPKLGVAIIAVMRGLQRFV